MQTNTSPYPGYDDMENDRLPISYYAPGPWHEDIAKNPYNRYDFTYRGYQCSINRNMLYAWCGYINVPEDYPETYDYICNNIKVHGGFTYYDGERVIGFDTCHAGDIVPYLNIIKKNRHPREGHFWTYHDTINEVKTIVDTLIEDTLH